MSDTPPFKPDVIVIGSGFGGAVSACRLAESGRKVLVLERGPERKPEEFPRMGSRPSSWLWNSRWNGLLDVRMFRRIATLTSSGVGGGSHVYANVHVRAPERSFREGWPEGVSAESLSPFYERVEHMLGVTPLPDSIELEKTRAFESAAGRLGMNAYRPNLAVYFGNGEHPRPDEPPQYTRDPHGLGVDVMQAPCRLCGECDIGCRTNSKNTLDLNYLALARQRYGAVVQPLAEVTSIAPENGGYRVRYRDRGASDAVNAVWAPQVVVAAGTVNTVELLLRCRDEHGTLPKLSDDLGAGFSGNGDFLAAAVNTDEPLNPWHGPTITAAAKRETEQYHYYLEEGGFAPDLAFFVAALRPEREYVRKFLRGPLGHALRLRWFYKEVARLTGDSEALESRVPTRTMIFLGMGEDGSDGRLQLGRRLGGRRKLQIQWEHARSQGVIDAMDRDLRRITRELGGSYVANPLWSVLGRLITVHPLGGAGISDDPNGVVDAFGEVRNYPNLFVADGSMIPRAIGPNPALTIAALAERTAEHIAHRP